MDYDAIKGLAKHHKQAFGRIVKCETYRLEGDRLLAVARMHDDYHDMNLAILLDAHFRIEEIAGTMDRIPYPRCETRPLEVLSALKGLAILERGGLAEVKRRIPRNQGCTHMYEMIEATFRSIFVGMYSIYGKEWEGVVSLDREEDRQFLLQSPILHNTCYGFHPDSVDEEVLGRARRKFEEAGKNVAIGPKKQGA